MPEYVLGVYKVGTANRNIQKKKKKYVYTRKYNGVKYNLVH